MQARGLVFMKKYTRVQRAAPHELSFDLPYSS
jgi:hypothetical protein